MPPFFGKIRLLDFRINLDEIGSEISQVGKVLCLSQGRIEPFATPQLEISFEQTPEAAFIWVGETADPHGGAVRDRLAVRRYSGIEDAEGVAVALQKTRAGPKIEIARTSAGSTPLYVTSRKQTLRITWKFEDAVAFIENPVPNKEACRIYIEHGAGRSRDQIIQGLCMLWPGESLEFGLDGLHFRESDPAQIALPNVLHDSARATDEFIGLIADALRPRLKRSARPIAEVSGGYDSGCVAVAAATIQDQLYSYGLIHEGPMGIQQRNRRRELITLLNLVDFEYPSYEHTPIRSLEILETALTPLDDNHRIPCAYAVDAHPAGGLDMIMTGVGGDELTMERTWGVEEWEVPGSVCTSAIVTATARADMFMRRGLWPVNPLLAQPVVDFCRALPKKMRSGRLLNQLALARAGLSDGFLFPRYGEHYGNGMQREAALYDFDAALSQSILGDFGIFDTSLLLRDAREAYNDGFSSRLLADLWSVMKLERVLASCLGHSRPSFAKENSDGIAAA